MAVQGPRVVLGLDYGTTYTGLAWMETTGQDSPSMDELFVYRNWPEVQAQKVPSTYSYSKTSGNKHYKQWGYSIGDDSQVMAWTKLELEPRSTVRELEVLRELVRGLDMIDNLRMNKEAVLLNDIPRHLTKDAGDIVRDYLGKVAREWYGYMKSQARYTLDAVPLDLVVTHPASWKYEAKNKTFRAVNGAFHSGLFPTLRNISLVSEPEACALYTVQDLLRKNLQTLIPGECFVLCDAGGGTVDLVSYRTESIEPLKISRIGTICGERCGATCIDRAFIEWLEPKLEDQDLLAKDVKAGGHWVLTPLGRVVLRGFESIKRAFTGTEKGDISLPRDIPVRENEESILNGMILLTEAHLKKTFEVSVSGVKSLIARQIIQVENAEVYGEVPCQVTNIFLAGGFAENEYLLNEVTKWVNSSGADIQVQRADDCWSGVVKGAVLRGMGMGMEPAVQVVPCPRHYGVCLSQAYADWKHGIERTVTDEFTGSQVVPERLVWLIRKGDLILPDEPILSKFDAEFRFHSKQTEGETRRVTFIATSIDNPPAKLSKLSKTENEIVHLDIPRTSVPTDSLAWERGSRIGSSYATVSVRIWLQINHGVRVTVECDGKTLKYHDTFL